MLRVALLALLLAPFGCSTNGLTGDQLNRLNTRDGGGIVDLGHGGGCGGGGDGGIVDGGNPFDGGAPFDAGWPVDIGTPFDGGWPVDIGAPFDAGGPADLGHGHGPHDLATSPTDLAH